MSRKHTLGAQAPGPPERAGVARFGVEAREPWVSVGKEMEPRRWRHRSIKHMLGIIRNALFFQHGDEFLFVGEFPVMRFLVINVFDHPGNLR